MRNGGGEWGERRGGVHEGAPQAKRGECVGVQAGRGGLEALEELLAPPLLFVAIGDADHSIRPGPSVGAHTWPLSS